MQGGGEGRRVLGAWVGGLPRLIGRVGRLGRLWVRGGGWISRLGERAAKDQKKAGERATCKSRGTRLFREEAARFYSGGRLHFCAVEQGDRRCGKEDSMRLRAYAVRRGNALGVFSIAQEFTTRSIQQTSRQFQGSVSRLGGVSGPEWRPRFLREQGRCRPERPWRGAVRAGWVFPGALLDARSRRRRVQPGTLQRV